MSRHAAGAMLGFAVWQIWLAIGLSQLPGGRALPWVAMALLVIAAMPFARHMERRWQRRTDGVFPSVRLLAEYRRERALLWLLALTAPPVMMGATLAVTGLFTLLG
jgi:hypothetical protein